MLRLFYVKLESFEDGVWTEEQITHPSDPILNEIEALVRISQIVESALHNTHSDHVRLTVMSHPYSDEPYETRFGTILFRGEYVRDEKADRKGFRAI